MKTFVYCLITAIMVTAALSGVALATDFKCGKKFITFPHHGGTYNREPYPAGAITVSRKDIVTVMHKGLGLEKAFIVAIRTLSGNDGYTRTIDERTSTRLIDCLD